MTDAEYKLMLIMRRYGMDEFKNRAYRNGSIQLTDGHNQAAVWLEHGRLYREEDGGFRHPKRKVYFFKELKAFLLGLTAEDLAGLRRMGD